MSEPIELFDLDGNKVIMHSPKVAEERVEQGLLLVNPPPKPVVKTKRPAVKAKE